MSGLFSTLNTASKGMNAQQTALHTTGHNISNANTEGYSRQRVEMKADIPYALAGVGQLGTGVKMEAVSRMVDDYVTRQIREEGGSLSQYSTKSQVLGQLEIIYNEPSDTGLNFNIGEVFQAWQELAKNPENLSSKTIVVEKSVTLSNTFNHIRGQLESVNIETDQLIEKDIMDMNAILKNLEGLNKQIFNISVKGHTPNDLLDQRDLHLKNLSEIVDFETTVDKWGRVEVNSGATPLLGLGDEGAHEAVYVGGAIEVDGVAIDITKGSMRGFLDAKAELVDQIDKFDEFGQGITQAFNDAHKLDEFGVEVAGAKDFFIYDNVTNTIKVNDDLVADNDLVLAGDNYGSPVGDGSRALEIAKLKDKQISFGAGQATIENRYNTMITEIGISKQHADNMVSNQEVLMGQLEMRRESTSGVSIDEEVTNMIKFQKGFEANARVIATLTEMLDVLINRTGV